MSDRIAAQSSDDEARARPVASKGDGPAVGESCDYCFALTLTWRKCKLICTSCSQINKSCADL